MTAHSVGQAAESGSTELHLEEFPEGQGWYIMQCAHKRGIDLHETMRELRSRVAARAGVQRMLSAGGEHTPESETASAVAAAQPPAGSGLSLPPGFAGEIARFIYASAPRPVVEVSVVAALGLLAGICGRGWHIPQSGLNLYIVLVARSAIGKEAMHTGISKLIYACQKKFPNADQFVSFDDFASGQALTKGCVENPCFVNVTGEIGHKFSEMAKDKDPAMRSLRRTMTNLYTKSGPDAMAGGIAYSDAAKSVKVNVSIAYSLIGETTPARFFESITSDMMSDGFLSRFNVIEYEGERPDKNRNPLERPDERLVHRLADMLQQAQQLYLTDKFQPVQREAAVALLVEAFDNECDRRIREAGDDETQRQMWNRAHLKALRISALLAVADNYIAPCITTEHFEWAEMLVRRDIAVFTRRLRSGEIGEGSDEGRERKLLDLCRDYLAMADADVPGSWKPLEGLRQRGLVARKYLQNRTQRLAAFEKHPRGHKAALETAIQTAVDNGHLMPVSKARLADDFGFHGLAYAVLNVGKFNNTNWMQDVLERIGEAK